MKLTYTLGAAALLSALALQPALGQGTSSEPSSSALSSEGWSSASSAFSSAMSSEPSVEPLQVNYGTLISSLQAGKMADLSSITTTTAINFVAVSDIRASGNTTGLDNALKKNEANVTQLRTDVAANTVLPGKLTAAGYTADQVVAVVEVDGSIVVIVDA